MIRKSVTPVSAAVGSILILLVAGLVPAPRAASGPLIPQALRDRVARDGRIRVIVELNPKSGGHVAEGRMSGLAAASQRGEIRAAATRVISNLRSGTRDLVRRFDTVPYVVLEIDADSLAAIERSSDVVQVMDDPIIRPTLAESVPLIQGDQVWAAGFTGTGTTIAVIDTGVDPAHPFLTGKISEEACYSSTVPGLSQTVCPNGLTSQIGPGIRRAPSISRVHSRNACRRHRSWKRRGAFRFREWRQTPSSWPSRYFRKSPIRSVVAGARPAWAPSRPTSSPASSACMPWRRRSMWYR